MARWSDQIEKNVKEKYDAKEHLLRTFFVSRVYEPQTEREQQEFEEFSLISNAMALMIYIAESDKVVKPGEKQRIIDELTYQLQYRPDKEYKKLSDEFGEKDQKIIEHLYDKLLEQYEEGKLDLDETLRLINMVYKNNPKKRFYLLRLCYYCAFSDKNLKESEKEAIDEVAEKLHIEDSERDRIKEEVKEEISE
jgi:uncharacterized tellurite resistance protein B-like protein